MVLRTIYEVNESYKNITCFVIYCGVNIRFYKVYG